MHADRLQENKPDIVEEMSALKKSILVSTIITLFRQDVIL